MNILVLTNYGMGLYKFRKELLETLCKSNNVVTALPDSEYTESLKSIGCEFIQFEFDRRSINPIADFKQIIRYKKLIKNIKPDVVLTYTIKPNVYGGIACRLTKTPYIVNVTGLGTSIENGGVLGTISRMLYKVGLKKASCVFFQNKDNCAFFEKKKLFFGNARVIPGSGVNLDYHVPYDYPSEDNGIKFVFIGRIMRDKGIEELLEAMKSIHKKFPYTSLDIIGGCDENYEDVLNDNEIADYIHYHGQQADVRPFIRSSHCIVLPSYHEGTANVLLESAATCRPVIATRVHGCMETFDEGISGLGCDLKNIDSLTDAMAYFVELPFEIKKQFGIAGRKKMENEYDRNIVIESYLYEIETINIGGKHHESV